VKSQLGSIAQSIGFGSSSASQLDFARNYFRSYSFLANFIYEFDLIDEILMLKTYDKTKNELILYKNAEQYTNEAVFPDGIIDYSHPKLQKAVKEFRKIASFSPGRENDPSNYLSVVHQSPYFANFLCKNLIISLNRDIANIDIEKSIDKVKHIESMFDIYDAIEVKRSLSFLVESELTKQVLASSVDGNSFLVLDPPVLPIDKFSPRRSILTINGFLLGLIISILFFTFKFSRSSYVK